MLRTNRGPNPQRACRASASGLPQLPPLSELGKEISDFVAVLESAITDHDASIAELAVDTIDRELRDLSECFPEPRNATVTGGAEARSHARVLLKNLVLVLRPISVSSERAKFDEAAVQLATFRRSIAPTTEALKAAEPWSLFDRDNHDAHFAAVRDLYRASIDPRSVRARRPDND